MATGENQPNLYRVLYNAMNYPDMIGELLQHPEFRHRARQICYGIAGPADSEELLQDACLRILGRVSQLNPNSIRNEEEFFKWFSQLARHVHLSRVLSAAAMSSCTEKAEGWPDAPTDVPRDDMGRFLAHADACPYHTRLLQAKDKKLRAIFRRARGLDSQGRILLGAEMHTSIAEHKRRSQNWREAAFKKGRLFGHVALFNGGKEIASCGKFYDFSIHISRNELDPYAGLQIRGVTSSNPDEDMLLGFYALADVRHEGKEQTLELDNGYTVGLKINQVSETTFDIHFRCVETRTLEAGSASAEGATDGIVTEMTDDERLDSSSGGFVPSVPFPIDLPLSPESAGWWPLSPGWQAAAIFALLILVAVPCFWLGRKWGEIEGVAEGAELSAQEKESLATLSLPVQTSTVSGEELNPRTGASPRHHASGQTASADQSTQGSAQTSVTPPEALTRKDGGGRSPVGRDILDSALELQHLSDRISALREASRLALFRSSFTDTVDDQRSTSDRLLSYEDRGYSVNKPQRMRTSASFQKASYEDREGSSDSSVLHFATNDDLLWRIDDGLQHLHLRVKLVTKQERATARFRVIWVARESLWRKRSSVVKLYAYVYREGEKNSVHQDSYEVVGDSLDAAYAAAVGKAVKSVIDWIRRDNEERLSPSTGENGSAEQPGADAQKEELADDYRDGDVIDANRQEPEPVTSERGKDVDVAPRRAEATEEICSKD